MSAQDLGCVKISTFVSTSIILKNKSGSRRPRLCTIKSPGYFAGGVEARDEFATLLRLTVDASCNCKLKRLC